MLENDLILTFFLSVPARNLRLLAFINLGSARSPLPIPCRAPKLHSSTCVEQFFQSMLALYVTTALVLPLLSQSVLLLQNAGEHFKQYFTRAVRNDVPANAGLGAAKNVQNLALLMQSRRQYLVWMHPN